MARSRPTGDKARDRRKRRRGRGGTSTLPGAVAVRRAAGADPAGAARARAASLRQDEAWLAQQRAIEGIRGSVDAGLVLHRAGDLDGAAAEYLKVLALDPKSRHALHLLGAIALSRGQAAEAETLIRSAMAVDDPTAAMHTNLALALRALGRLPEAADECRRALQLTPGHTDARFNLGLCVAGLGDAAGAEEAFRRVVEEAPALAQAWFELGQALAAQERWADAAPAYTKASELDPANAEYNLRQGLALLEDGELTQAARALERCLTISPDNPDAYFLLGTAKTRQGFHDEAIEAYEAAVRLRPDFAHALSNLGSALRKRDRVAEATAAYARAIEADPKHANARFNLGNLHLELGDLEAAEASYREVVERSPGYFGAWVNLGNALVAQGRADEAVDAYRRATREGSATEVDLGWRNLGNALTVAGDVAGARMAWERAWEVRHDDSLRVRRALALPAVLGSGQERTALAEGLDAGVADLEAGALNLHPLASALDLGVERLAWHDLDRPDLMERLVEVFRNADPDLGTSAPHVFVERADGPIRVGFLSASLHQPEVGLLVRGLLRALPRDRFHVQAFSTRAASSALARSVAAAADEWTVLESLYTKARTRLMEGTLDVLLLPDPLAHPLTLLAPYGRPARVQATLMAPGSTGLPGVVALVADEALAAGAEERYTETVVALPSPPMFLARPAAGRASEARSPRYVCAVRTEQVTPELDALAAQILAADPDGALAVRCHGSGFARQALAARMTAAGVPADRLVLVAPEGEEALLALLGGARAVLDPPGASDPVIAALALGLGVPVMTMPGEIPRSRGALACYRRIGLADYVAGGASAYVEGALALGRASEGEARATREALSAAAAPLFDAHDAVAALADALEQAVAEA